MIATTPERRAELVERLVCWKDGGVMVRDDRLLGPREEADRASLRFLERAFRVPEVGSVAVDRDQAAAWIRPARVPGNPAGFLGKLAAALRADDERGLGSATTLPRAVRLRSFTVYRHGQMLSTCEVLADRPGWLRLRHPTLRSDPLLAQRFERMMAAVPGVTRSALSARGSVLGLRYDRGVIAPPRLLRMAEEVLDAPAWWDRAVPPPERTSFALPNANLAIGAAADLALPALAPLSAALLIYSNLKTFRLAWHQGRRRQVGLPVLYSCIVVGTLASGQFLASALMSWSLKFWHDRLRRDLSAERRRLLAECLPLPELARVANQGDVDVLVPVDRLRPGDRVAVAAGEVVPADGKVVGGGGIVDEGAVRGRPGASRVAEGDLLLAGSTVRAGSLLMEVGRPVAAARVSAISRAILSATTLPGGVTAPTLKAERSAERAVVPTITMAGVGLLTGDLATAAAILRPDYATGPAIAVPLETVKDAADCARKGMVVRSPEAFERLARVDTILLDDNRFLRDRGLEVFEVRTRLPEDLLLRLAASAYRHLADDRAEALSNACRRRRIHLLDLPPREFDPGVAVEYGGRLVRVRDLDDGPLPKRSGPLAVEVDGTVVGVVEFEPGPRPRASEAVSRLRERPGTAVLLLSGRPEPEAAALAAALGIPAWRGGMSAGDKEAFLRACRALGRRTAFVGDGREAPGAASEADVAISTGGDPDCPDDPSAVVLLHPDLDRVPDLLEIARAHSTRIRGAQTFVVLPNVLCVAGAFFLGVSALAVVVVSNLSTFGLYRRTASALRSPRKGIAALPAPVLAPVSSPIASAGGTS
ncbi:P-type ATPase [Tautonia sociabilis]|uniref:HAD family hydrolase n=1 Tax=Tautonia sociabilis TaxID=2080755 RepID=A0A432MEJ4_9BACT|nr:HAD family hydrolase [Tautonia sociabilis]RUL83945.1 HAD family hydrolase [Tautonia sociabilis]